MKIKMKSKEMVKQVEAFFTPDVSKVFNLCGLGYIKVVPSHKAEKTKLRDANLWLQNFSQNVLEYQAVRCLHTDETWDNFFGLFQDTMSDAEEVIQLNLKKEQLIRVWKQRPGVLRKTSDARL
jgi:hypothetical protein